jgi:hypothetical protein
VGRDAARLGATVAVWATPIAWYAVTQPLYQHGCAFGAVALLVERWDARLGDDRPARFVWLGLLGGMAMMMRAQEVLYLLLPAGEILVRLWRPPEGSSRRRWLVGGLVFGAAALLAFAPQLFVWRYYTGAFTPVQAEPIRWGTPMWMVALFSTRSGLFPWSPIAYASVLGLVLARKARTLTYSLLAVFALELYIVAAAWVPSGAYSYGARRLSDAAPLLGLGTALLYDRLSAMPWRRRAVAAFTALCVALTCFSMEMQRAHGVSSSGGFARTAGKYLEQVGAPVWLQRFFETVGYPFVQPMGWLFALYHRAPVYAFEGVVGNFQLDRDGQWFTLLSDWRNLPLQRDHRANVAAGLVLEDKAPARVIGPVRLLVSMFAQEKIAVRIPAQVAEGPVAVIWNGRAVPVTRRPDLLWFEVPAALVRPGVNELSLDVPIGSRLTSLEFDSLTRWWDNER